MLGWKRASALRSCLCTPPRKLTPTTQLSPARALHPSAHAKLEEPILNLKPRAEQLTETFISTQADLPQAPTSPAPNSSSTPKETLYSILIILAALAGIFARWWALSKTSLWWDEGYSLWISQFSLKEIWRGVAADTSPPLYYFLLHGWIHLFGRSEFALRSMSALFETLSIPIFYLIARRVLQDKLAIAAAMWLYALSAFQAQYARDARFYAVLCFFALAAVYSLIEFMEMRSYVYFAALILCLDAGLYIHNMMLFYLLGIAVLWLVYPAKPNLRRRVLDGLLCALAVFFLFLPWLPNLLLQRKFVAQYFWVRRPSFRDLAQTINTISGLDNEYLSKFASHLIHLNLYPVQGFFLAACLLLLVLCGFAGIAQAIPPSRRKLLALLGFALIPLLLVFSYSRIARPVYLDRIFIPSSAILPLILAACFTHQSGKRRMLFDGLGMILLTATAISLAGFLWHFQKENWRGATARILAIPPEQRLVVFVTNAGQVLFDYYAAKSPDTPARPQETALPEPYNYRDPVLRGLPSFRKFQVMQTLQQAVESANFTEIDVVISHSPLVLDELVRNYLLPKYTQVSDEDFYQLNVVRWKLRASP